MLIQSSLPTSLSPELSFVSDLGEQPSVELLCDWSHCGGIWQKSLNDKCPLDNSGKSICTGEEGSKISCSGVVEISRSSSDISVVKDMCANFASKWDGLVYKRRRLRRSTVTLLSGKNATDCDKGINGSKSSIVSTDHPLKSALEHCSRMHASCSSSKSDTGEDSAVMKTEVDCGECSSSVAILTDSAEEFTSARELCISVLKRNGLLVGVNTISACAASEVLRVIDANISQPCKICSLLENPLKMLICDLCEEAFHLSCCRPKVKKLPVDYWYCQPCLRKRPKGLLENSYGKSANIFSEHRYRNGCSKGSPISWMLNDNQPYRSEVRIGKAFQAEIPEWTGPISEDYNYFNEHFELDHAEYVNHNGWNAEEPFKSSAFGNWIQCREVIRKNKKDKGIMCGKWRRAPLFVVQTDNWDCSCSVLWDPHHADCAVPQELETDVILEHLKYVEMLRPWLNISKHSTLQTAINGPE